MNRTHQIVPTSEPITRGAIGPSAVGRALDPDDREFFEDRFGSDFSHVRVHTDAPAAALADNIGANAFAAGDDIAFASGRYAPSSARGRELLAHELAHVAQQHAGGGAGAASAEPRARRPPRRVACRSASMPTTTTSPSRTAPKRCRRCHLRCRRCN
jgi:hypothetical protein